MLSGEGFISTIGRALRVYQWPKNLLIFAALVFSQEFRDLDQLVRTFAGFGIMCAASSAVYIFNDLRDREKDRAHPEKCKRPFASGALSPVAGVALMLFLLILALTSAFGLSPMFGGVVVAYGILNLSYSMGLKNLPIFDVLLVALGFVFRAVGGAFIIDVSISSWLVVCTLFLALFLALGKRRHELIALEDAGISHREVLQHYSVELLEYFLIIMATSTLLVYVSYVISDDAVTENLYVTVPIVVYGLFRYFWLAHQHSGGGDPSRTLLQDRPLLATVLVWGLTCVLLIYAESQGFFIGGL